MLRADVMAQLASVLALVADYGKDRVGLLLFSDRVEWYIPPHKGRSHIRRLMEAAFNHRSTSKKTDIAGALHYIARLPKRDAMVFLISDFIDHHAFDKALKNSAYKHDVIALRCLDEREQIMPSLGFVTVQDSETGTTSMLDMRARGGMRVRQFLQQRIHDQNYLFKRYGIDCVDVYLNKPFVGDIIRLFRRRMMY